MCPVVPTHNILAVAAGAGKKIKLVACALWPVPCAPDFSKRITPGATPFIAARVYLQPGGLDHLTIELNRTLEIRDPDCTLTPLACTETRW